MTAIINCTGRSHMAMLPALHAELLQALSLSDDVVVCVDEVETADLGFLQLMESARLHAANNDKSFSLSAPVAGPMRERLEDAGLLTEPSPDTLAFWCHEEDAQ